MALKRNQEGRCKSLLWADAIQHETNVEFFANLLNARAELGMWLDEWAASVKLNGTDHWVNATVRVMLRFREGSSRI